MLTLEYCSILKLSLTLPHPGNRPFITRSSVVSLEHVFAARILTAEGCSLLKRRKGIRKEGMMEGRNKKRDKFKSPVCCTSTTNCQSHTLYQGNNLTIKLTNLSNDKPNDISAFSPCTVLYITSLYISLSCISAETASCLCIAIILFRNESSNLRWAHSCLAQDYISELSL